MQFNLVSDYTPTGDQPEAISALTDNLNRNVQHQVLLGVTGSGKTFTAANVIARYNRPTLVLSHNKTLAAQLFEEFKRFFPENAVEYFVSYYDYYQPEAYLPTTGTYIEKDLSINEEIEKCRHSTTNTLLSGRRDVIVVSSVSCIYGMGNPEAFRSQTFELKLGQLYSRQQVIKQLIAALYTRTTEELLRGHFRVRGETLDVALPYTDHLLRVAFFGNAIEQLAILDPLLQQVISTPDAITVYPANLFVTSPETLQQAIQHIEDDLDIQTQHFKELNLHTEAARIKERVAYDLDMMRELGYCSGIENYSRYLDGRLPGTRPFCLLDYFPKDFLMLVDESHVTLPQVRGMYGGDRSRKQNLVDYGFRLPAALDNRPLTFEEFQALCHQVIYISATPGEYEIEKSGGLLVEQVIRPTGVLDPLIEIRPCTHQVDNLMHEISQAVSQGERVLVTTLTKRMAEELSAYLLRLQVKCRYLHSDIDTLERVEILRQLRVGIIDVLIGINLLREGLDLPEVALVAILDADKEGFLRNTKSLIQTVGRAARHVNGRVILYADRETDSIKATVSETRRRRALQQAYNTEHNIIPRSAGRQQAVWSASPPEEALREPGEEYLTAAQLKVNIKVTKAAMKRAAKAMDFITAAKLRDAWRAYQNQLDNLNQ